MASYPPPGNSSEVEEANLLFQNNVITEIEKNRLTVSGGPAVREAYILWIQGASKIVVEYYSPGNIDWGTYTGQSTRYVEYNGKEVRASWLLLNGVRYPGRIRGTRPSPATTNSSSPISITASSTNNSNSATTPPTKAPTTATAASTAVAPPAVAVAPPAAPATPAPTAAASSTSTATSGGTFASGPSGAGSVIVPAGTAAATPPPPPPPAPPAAPTPATTAPASTTGSAADERIEAQCILIDYISTLSQDNYKWRKSRSNNKDFYDKATANGGGGTKNYYMIGMTGDGEDFSSLINGSQLKGKFLDFTTAQLSSLTPVVKLYKVQQQEDGSTLDYLIPFPTHAAWLNANSNTGQIRSNDFQGIGVDENQNQVPLPINVGLKSFDWQFEGSNPVSSKVDIKAKLVLFAKSLTDLLLGLVRAAVRTGKGQQKLVDKQNEYGDNSYLIISSIILL